MNNEERILDMLTRLTADVTEIKGIVTKHSEHLDELDTRSLRSAVLLETEVARDIRLVYEGQEMLRQKMDELAPKERVEVLEDEVVALKSAMKMMVKRLEALEKAQ